MQEFTITPILNGTARRCTVPANLTLIDLLRDHFGLQGCKPGCDQAVCGACTVLRDGVPITSCTTLAALADGHEILTIEGVGTKGAKPGLHPVQQAFLKTHAVQCGYCTAGMVLMTIALLARDPTPSDQTIRRWLGGHLCRCTGYLKIIEAIKLAAQLSAQ